MTVQEKDRWSRFLTKLIRSAVDESDWELILVEDRVPKEIACLAPWSVAQYTPNSPDRRGAHLAITPTAHCNDPDDQESGMRDALDQRASLVQGPSASASVAGLPHEQSRNADKIDSRDDRVLRQPAKTESNSENTSLDARIPRKPENGNIW
jgi:hypothetical protein